MAGAVSASAFLRAIFGEGFPGWLVLWRSDNRRSLWLKSEDLQQADAWVERCRSESGANAYFGCGLQGIKGAAGSRGTADEVRAIPGCWLDVDCREDAGKKKSKKNYAPRAVALEVLRTMPLAPSVVVESGGGLHAYWLLRELLAVSGPVEKVRAERLVRGWEELFGRKLAAAAGGPWDIDHVSDLARVLRPVGSWNFKWARNVGLYEGYEEPAKWARYAADDLEPFLPDDLPAAPSVRSTEARRRLRVFSGDLSLDPAANPVTEKLDALRENSREFRLAWEHRGKDFPSNSERELSLASWAVQANWTDQEIADLIVAHRRRWEPEKLDKAMRLDYVAATIARARGDSSRDSALRALAGEPGVPVEDAVEAAAATVTAVKRAEAAKPAAVEPKLKRERLLAMLSAVFGLNVEGWLQFGLERPIFTLVHDGGKRLRIGSVSAVVRDDGAFREAVYLSTGHVVPPVGKKRWPTVLEALAAIRDLDEAEDATTLIAVRGIVEAYLTNEQFDQKMMAVPMGKPFIEGGRVSISVPALFRHANLLSGERWERLVLFSNLKDLGWTPQRVYVGDGERRYWSAPVDEWRHCMKFMRIASEE